jgi:hypothetical protein
MSKSLPFESFTGRTIRDNDPTTASLDTRQEAEALASKKPFGLDLLTTITAPELRIGVVACAISKNTQVDDSTGAQDMMEATSPLVIDNIKRPGR